MLSSDIFSYLDDDCDSPGAEICNTLQISSEQQQHHGLSLFEQISDVRDVDGNFPTQIDLNTVSLKKVNEINVEPGEEEDLMNYLSGEKVSTESPFVKLLRDSVPRRSSRRSRKFADPGLCMSRNAVAARELRQKKKVHIENLEKSLEILKCENKTLKSESLITKKNIVDLKEEVSYLRSVLANHSALASLLQNIPNTPGIKFQSSVTRTNAFKPTASVTGILKTPPLKPKVIFADEDAERRSESMCDVSINQNEPKMINLESRFDHDYAAEPKRLDRKRKCGPLVDLGVPNDLIAGSPVFDNSAPVYNSVLMNVACSWTNIHGVVYLSNGDVILYWNIIQRSDNLKFTVLPHFYINGDG